jgi:hypothetical protein
VLGSEPVRLHNRAFALITFCFATIAQVVAQDSNPAIEQSRLFPRTVPPTSGEVTADGIALPAGESTSAGDGNFGAQQILKNDEKIPDLTVGGGVSLFYTSNVALTNDVERSDGFFVFDSSVNWTPRINSQLQFQLGGGASIFRYFDTSALDFEDLGVGTGVTWMPPNAWGIAITGRYDFVELLDKHSNQILQDHEFSAALQKIFVFGRSHALTVALLGSAGISDPFAEQRDQIGFAVGYHLQLTRYLGSDIGYRHSWYFYNAGGRHDLNQVVSFGLHYFIRPWATVNAFASFANNQSNESAFEYNVFSGGGGLGLTIRF